MLGTANLGNEIVPRTDNSLVVMANDGSNVHTARAHAEGDVLAGEVVGPRCDPHALRRRKGRRGATLGGAVRRR